MENTKYGNRREVRWTPIRAKAQDTRANPNRWETHLVRKRWDIGLLRALSYTDYDDDDDDYISSGYKAATSANKRIGQKRRQKTAAWLLYGHMFLLCGARPYACIGWLCAWGSAICFYYAALGYMFVWVGCRRGAGPY